MSTFIIGAFLSLWAQNCHLLSDGDDLRPLFSCRILRLFYVPMFKLRPLRVPELKSLKAALFSCFINCRYFSLFDATGATTSGAGVECQ